MEGEWGRWYAGSELEPPGVCCYNPGAGPMEKAWSCFMFNLGMRLSEERGTIQCCVCSFVHSPRQPPGGSGTL